MEEGVGKDAGFSLKGTDSDTEDANGGSRRKAVGKDPNPQSQGEGARGLNCSVRNQSEVTLASKVHSAKRELDS